MPMNQHEMQAEHTSALQLLRAFRLQATPKVEMELVNMMCDHGHAFEGLPLDSIVAREQPNDMLLLALLHMYGVAVKQDLVRAVDILRHEAPGVLLTHSHHHKTSGAARYRLGFCYYEGYGVEKSVTTAMSYWAQAADLGNARAQCALGRVFDNLLLEGDALLLADPSARAADARRRCNAETLYRLSADQGDPEAAWNLALLLYPSEESARAFLRLGDLTQLQQLQREEPHLVVCWGRWKPEWSVHRWCTAQQKEQLLLLLAAHRRDSGLFSVLPFEMVVAVFHWVVTHG